jgi:hypothetical protein
VAPRHEALLCAMYMFFYQLIWTSQKQIGQSRDGRDNVHSMSTLSWMNAAITCSDDVIHFQVICVQRVGTVGSQNTSYISDLQKE